MKYLSIIFAYGIVFSIPCYARNLSCNSLLTTATLNISLTVHEPVLGILIPQESKRAEMLERIQIITNELRANFPSLAHPERLDIRIGSVDNKTLFLGKMKEFEAHVSLAEEMRFGLGWMGAPNKVFNSILRHEYGHSIFLESYMRESKDFRYIIETERAKERNDPEVRYRVLDALAISGPYDEVFADLIAFLITKDNSQFKDALEYRMAGEKDINYKKFLSQEIESRGRSKSLFDSSWSNNHSPHALLEPVRSFLWSRYLEVGSRVSKDSFAKMVFESFYSEIEARLKEVKLHEVSPSEMSLRTLKALHDRMSDL